MYSARYFNEDNTLGGALDGAWSFNEGSNKLTVNDTEIMVDSAWDWEASPRKTTITYAGFTPEGRSIWGKKVSNDKKYGYQMK